MISLVENPPFLSMIVPLNLHWNLGDFPALSTWIADIFPGDRTREPVGGQGGRVPSQGRKMVRAAPKIRISWWYDIDNMLWMVI